MDDSGRTKYAVLFNVYGGPGSQTVDLRFAGYDWHGYLACGLQYIVVAVDGRGTGFKGRGVRSVVKGDLGFWETQDQVSAARIWAGRNYVDPRRIGIWGWVSGRVGEGWREVRLMTLTELWRVHGGEGCRGAQLL